MRCVSEKETVTDKNHLIMNGNAHACTKPKNFYTPKVPHEPRDLFVGYSINKNAVVFFLLVRFNFQIIHFSQSL
jgi:hypothetical protein